MIPYSSKVILSLSLSLSLSIGYSTVLPVPQLTIDPLSFIITIPLLNFGLFSLARTPLIHHPLTTTFSAFSLLSAFEPRSRLFELFSPSRYSCLEKEKRKLERISRQRRRPRQTSTRIKFTLKNLTYFIHSPAMMNKTRKRVTTTTTTTTTATEIATTIM